MGRKYFPWAKSTRNLKTAFSPWKHIKCFPSTIHRGNLKTQYGSGFVFEENSATEITWWSFPRSFPSTLKRKPGVFKFLRFEKRFQKAPLSWLLSVDGRPDCRNKNVFSNFSVVKWTGHSQRSSPLTPNTEATQSPHWSVVTKRIRTNFHVVVPLLRTNILSFMLTPS